MTSSQPDPLNILSSTKPIVEQSRFVSIREDAIADVAAKVMERFKQGLDTQEMSFGSTGDLKNDVQLIFLENVVNFCFWSGKDEPKWRVEGPDGAAIEGGWYGLKTCFERGLKENVPILDARYLASFPAADAERFFRGVTVPIPLLEKRIENLREAGAVLSQKFDGSFMNVLEASNYNAPNLAGLIIDHFSSFRDISALDGEKIFFLKRAQICPNDLNYALRSKGKTISDLENLTAFADYKLPQILRMFGVFEYKEELASKIDNYIELPHDSREEIELRASTIWAVELLRQCIPSLTAGDIDNTLWLMSQTIQSEAKPYHRTRTIYY